MGESTTDRRRILGERLNAVRGADSKNALIAEIRKALAVRAPVGDPATIEAAGQRYRRAAAESEQVHQQVTSVAGQGLPDVWTGSTGARATEVVAAAGRAVDQQTTAFHQGANALLGLADALRGAQSADRSARSHLEQVLGSLGGEDGFFDDMHEDDEEEAARKRAAKEAVQAVEGMRQAAVRADDAARAAARDLNKLASEARASRLNAPGISAADKLVLAETSGANGPTELNELLSSTDMRRAGEYLSRMNDRDRAEFEKMLGEASSPQERAYLMKALASGRGPGEIRTFRDKIHGKDPEWLRRHLSPVYTEDGDFSSGGQEENGANKNRDTVGFRSGIWQQPDDEGTCVASSTITARALVDPVFALEMTGGPSGQEEDPEAFKRRLLAEQHRVHVAGDGGDGWDGMDAAGQEKVMESEVSPHTGARYDYKEMPNPDDRRALLPQIEKAVAEGKPVPVGVEGTDENGEYSGHALMIVGQEGGMLQVYNPWGTTTWVSEEDFINGRMAGASDNRLPTAFDVHLPK
ncbi:peptidoglycan-binding protein [Kitasatospora sp. NPDC004240]